MSGFIELCGAPGVGKSTLVAALAGRRVFLPGGHATGAVTLLPADRLTCVPRSPFRLLGPAMGGRAGLAALAARPRLARLMTRALSVEEIATRMPLASGTTGDLLADLPLPAADDPRADPSYRDAALGWLEDTLRILQLAAELPAGVVALLGEGVVQRTVSLLGASASETETARLVARLPRPVAVVHLVAAPELIERRARARAAAGLTPQLHAGRDVEQAVGVALGDADAIARVVAGLARTGVPLVDVPVGGDGSPDESADARADESADVLALRVLRALGSPGEAAGGPPD